MLWVARIGKLLAFLAGTTIVLDVVGPDRMIAWGGQIQKADTTRARVYWAVTIFCGFATGVSAAWGRALGASFSEGEDLITTIFLYSIFGAGGVAMGMATSFLAQKTPAILVWFGGLLANPRLERWLRGTAIPLFLLGFGLDYLGS